MSTVTQIHKSRSGIAEALRAAAQPIELDTAPLADIITTYCRGLAQTDRWDDPGFVRAFGKLRALTKAISATDYLVGYGEGTLVEVPGIQPAGRLDEGRKRAHEITAILDRVRQDDEGLDVAALGIKERHMVAALCFHAARRCDEGRDFVSMDELDYMRDMGRNVPHAVARRIARLESLAGRALFPRGDGSALLASLCNWGATEQAICAERGYMPVLLIEGRRRVVYEPQTVLSSEQQMSVPTGLEGELAIAHVLQSATLGPNPLGHEAIVIALPIKIPA